MQQITCVDVHYFLTICHNCSTLISWEFHLLRKVGTIRSCHTSNEPWFNSTSIFIEFGLSWLCITRVLQPSKLTLIFIGVKSHLEPRIFLCDISLGEQNFFLQPHMTIVVLPLYLTFIYLRCFNHSIPIDLLALQIHFCLSWTHELIRLQ